MKRIFTLLLCLTALVSTASAQDVLWLDYCSGQYNTTQRAIAEVGEIEVAIHFNHDQLAELAGNEISQLAMAFPTTHPSAMKMWIRADRDGENLREIDVTKIVSKWNTYAIESPLPLTGAEQDLWVGATFEQKYVSNKYISMAGNTNAEGCYYRVSGGEWKNKANEDVGSLCIRMGVSGDNIPKHDMSLSRVSADELNYGLGEVVPFTARITNHGVDNVVNPIVRCSINGEVVADVTVTASIVSSEYADVTIKVPTETVAAPGIATFSFEALWADGQPDTHPENNTAAINVGLVKPLHDLALEGVRAASAIVKLGSNITINGTIRNNNYASAQNPQIIYTINGGEPTKKSVSCTLKKGESKDFSFTIATRSYTEDCDLDLDFELVWRDGSVDDYAADNKAQLKVRLTTAAPNRRMVVEEGTGTWCGWCVRGIVGMHDMAAKYPEQFIGIAVHANDEMQNSVYVTWLTNRGVTGYPCCFINREPNQRDPSFSTMESYLKGMTQYSELDVVSKAELSKESFDMHALVTPLVDLPSSDYSVVFAMTEDHITGMQSNYYAGGGSGVMGGYEKLGSSVKVDFMDVAIGMWPASSTASGPEFDLPASMQGGQVYTVDYSLNPKSVSYRNLDNCNVIALIIDNTTGEIANAAKFSQALVGINSVLAPTSDDAPAYNLAGQRIGAQHTGIAIEGGKKVLR